MSRTDQHRPWWTRLRDSGSAIEKHNHESSECDLVPLKEWMHLLAHDPEKVDSLKCSWTLSHSKFMESPVCGCKMCTQSEYKRKQRRSNRHRGKHESTDLTKEYRKNDLEEE